MTKLFKIVLTTIILLALTACGGISRNNNGSNQGTVQLTNPIDINDSIIEKNILNLTVTEVTDHTAVIKWEGISDVKVWIRVHDNENTTGVKYNATNNQYTFDSLGADTSFTVYVQVEGSDLILEKEFRTIEKALSCTQNQHEEENLCVDDSNNGESLNYQNTNSSDNAQLKGDLTNWGADESQMDKDKMNSLIITAYPTTVTGHDYGELASKDDFPIDAKSGDVAQLSNL
jgi:hypothetical protein